MLNSANFSHFREFGQPYTCSQSRNDLESRDVALIHNIDGLHAANHSSQV